MSAIHRPTACLALLVLVVGCGGGKQVRPPSDAELARRFDAARAAYQQGQDAQAASLYQRAADQAYVRDDLVAAAEAMYSRAVCLLRIRRFDDAAASLQQAEQAVTLSGGPARIDVTLLKARLAYEQGRHADAASLARQVIRDDGAKPAWCNEAFAIVGLAGLALDDDAAAAEALTSIKPLTPHGQAEYQRLRGRLAMRQRQWFDAANAFDREAEFRQQTRSYFAMARALAEAAHACEQADQLQAAAERYLRAGRSMARQSDGRADAQAWLASARRIALGIGANDIAHAASDELAQLKVPK